MANLTVLKQEYNNLKLNAHKELKRIIETKGKKIDAISGMSLKIAYKEFEEIILRNSFIYLVPKDVEYDWVLVADLETLIDIIEQITLNTSEQNLLKAVLTSNGFEINFDSEDENCAEISKQTELGVSIFFTLNPFTRESFFRCVANFDVDDEIDLHRQDSFFRKNYSIAENLIDFTDFKTDLLQIEKHLLI